MNKAERASYLVSLLSLMEGQDTSGVHNRSQVLANEFNKHWDQLKAEIQQENEDEARKRDKLDKRRDQARNDRGEDQPGGSEPDRAGSGLSGRPDDNGQGTPRP